MKEIEIGLKVGYVSAININTEKLANFMFIIVKR